MDDVLTPLERSVKNYLFKSVGHDLAELMAKLAVERPDEAHLWLAQQLLLKSKHPSRYTIVMNEGIDSRPGTQGGGAM